MKKLIAMVAIVGVVALAGTAHAGGVGLRAVGIDAGYVSPDNIDGTWTAGFNMDFGVPMANVYFQPFVNYWKFTETVLSIDASLADIAYGASVKYIIPTAAPTVQPFVGAGAAAHRLTAAIDGFGDVTDTKFGYHFGGGVQVGVAERMNIVGQGWYTLVEDLNQWSVRGGFSWTL